MGIGIQICGLNGCGKSTLGRALAEKIGFHFIDIKTCILIGVKLMSHIQVQGQKKKSKDYL